MIERDAIGITITWLSWTAIVIGAVIAFLSGSATPRDYGVVIWFIGIVVQLQIGVGVVVGIILRLTKRGIVASQT